jgi:hypothetical protein
MVSEAVSKDSQRQKDASSTVKGAGGVFVLEPNPWTIGEIFARLAAVSGVCSRTIFSSNYARQLSVRQRSDSRVRPFLLQAGT